MKSYSTRDVAGLLGISEPQVRAQARAGFLRPGRGPRNAYRFSFQDLVLLRAAKSLAEARLPVRRIRRALRHLVRQLPAGRPLSELRITHDGQRIVVRDNGTAWQPESGQLVLDFTVARLARRAKPLARRAAREARAADPGLTAAQWYDLGVDLEAAAPDEARDAYRRALDLDPRHADAHVNLGRLLYQASDVPAAAAHFRRALALRRSHATAAYNLGIALEDLGQPREATEAYRRAIAADPLFADAHFNLSRLYEAAGKQTAAIRHLRAYRDLLRRP